MKFLILTLFLASAMSAFSQTTTDTIPPSNGTNPVSSGDPNFGAANNQNSEEDVTDNKKEDNEKFNVIGALLSYNFSGNNKVLKNLTPVVNYGWKRVFDMKKKKQNNEVSTEEVTPNTLTSKKRQENKTKNKENKWDVSINPYAAGQIDVKDSASYIPGLMLPGIAGITINSMMWFEAGAGYFLWAPLNFGFKLISDFADSSSVIAQHNLRTMVGYSYKDLFNFGVQYTYGWHNATSESEKLFKQVFSRGASDLHYLLISLETKLSNASSDKPAYFFAEWRGLLNGKKFSAFDNTKIVTFGIRTSLDAATLIPARNARNKPR